MRRRKYAIRRRLTAAHAVAGGVTLLAGLLIGVGSAHAVSTPALSPVPVPSPVAPAPAAPVASPPAVAPATAAQDSVRTVLRAGEEFVVNDQDLCSTGFAVIGPAGQDGFLSAGHCGRAGQQVQTPQGAPLGGFVASDFPGTDYGWVATDAGFVGSAAVSRHDGTVAAVHGAAIAGVGAPVCMSGRASGWHCGTITAVEQTVSYDQGIVSGLTATSVCSDGGDSGGVFISGDQAQGITSGGVGDCASDGTTYFQPLAPALQAYGLSLRTR